MQTTPKSRWYLDGERDGSRNYAPDHRVYNAYSRVIRTMTADEIAEYDAGWKVGHARQGARRLARIDY